MVKMLTGDWISVSDAADVLGLSRRRVDDTIHDGRLKPTRVGSVHLLLRSDVEAFAKQKRKPGRPKKQPVAKKKPRKK